MMTRKSDSLTSDFVKVYTTKGITNAHAVCGFLKSFGIHAFPSQESAGVAIGITIGLLGDAYVYVPRDQAQKARTILLAYEKGEYAAAEGSQDDIRADDPPIKEA